MIMNYVLADGGFYADRMEITLGRVRMEWSDGWFVPAVAEEVTGIIHLTFDDLAAILRQPSFVKSLWSGVDGIARLDLSLDNAADGGLRLVGAVELLGQRFPISTTTRLRIEDARSSSRRASSRASR